MIDALNKKVEGRAQSAQTAGEPIPEGTYDVKVVKIEPWKPITKDVWVNLRDERGSVVKDDKNKPKKELQKNLTFYVCDVRLDVVSGDHKGRVIFTSLTTHPNAVFITEGFLFAVGEDEMTFGEIPTACVNKLLSVDTFNEEYTSKKTDPDTALEVEVTKTKTRVKRFIRPSHIIETPGVEYDI